MNIVGIVAEYNPFHNGHFFHLNKAKEAAKAEYSVAVVSSSFVQRGEPSIFTKWQRSEMAVRNGVDLVLELPVLYSSRSAYHFAFGSVYSLDKTNVITHLAFGSENPDLKELEKISSFLAEECDEFKIALKSYLNKGLSFPSSRERAIKDFFPEIITDLNQPNIILGLNYLKVLKELNSRIEPLPIQRIGQYHGLTPVENIAGATLIRNLMKENSNEYRKYLTDATSLVIDQALADGFNPAFLDKFNTQIMYLLRKSKPSELTLFPGVTEGLENKIYNSLSETDNIEDLVNLVKSKRFTETRIKRIFTEILLDIKTDMEKQNPEYLRILAFNEKGRDILRVMKEKSSLPIITKFADFYYSQSGKAKSQLDLEIRSTNIYAQIQRDKKFNAFNQDFINSPLFLS